jgi:hypothetical protein
VESVAPFGPRVLLVLHGREEIACADPVLNDVPWTRKLDAPIVAGPIGFERASENQPGGSGLVVVTAAGATRRTGVLSVLDGKDGATLGWTPLTSAPTPHSAIVGDRVLVALEGSVVACALSGVGAPRLVWEEKRPAREARGLAGEMNGGFFLLDGEALLAGDIWRGSLREVARFEPGSPARLAVRDGRPLVLTLDDRGEARIHCLDVSPGGPQPDGAGAVEVWSTDAGKPVGDDFSIAPFGVVIALAGELRILDPLTGATTLRFLLDAPPACPPATVTFSTYLLLGGGRVLRYAPGLERVGWSIDLTAAHTSRPQEAHRTASEALVVAGDRLVASLNGAPRVISERGSAQTLPWSQWRGGTERAGTCDGARMPLAARVLWRRRAPGWTEPAGARGPPAEEGMWLLPLPEGWIAGTSSAGRSHVAWLDDDGSLLGERMDDGRSVAAVRLEGLALVAMETGSGAGAVLSIGGERAAVGTSLRERWRAATPPLSSSHPLAAAGDLVVVALRSSVLAVGAGDGRRRWESQAVAGALAPLAAGTRVIVAGEDPADGEGLLAALAAGDGHLLWKRCEPGWRWGPATLSGDVLLVPAERDGRGRIDTLRPADGSVLRSVPLEGEAPRGPLAAAGGAVAYVGRLGATFLLSLDASTPARVVDGGEPPGRASTPLPILGFELMVVTAGRTMRCIDTSTLETVWQVDLPAPPLDAALDRGRIVVAAGGEIICLGSD